MGIRDHNQFPKLLYRKIETIKNGTRNKIDKTRIPLLPFSKKDAILELIFSLPDRAAEGRPLGKAWSRGFFNC